MTDPAPTTAEEREKWAAMDKQAAMPPWDADWCYGACRHIEKNVDTDAFYDGEGSGWNRHDGPFIAEMRNAFPRLLADVDRAAVRVAEVERVVEAARKLMRNYHSKNAENFHDVFYEMSQALAALDAGAKEKP